MIETTLSSLANQTTLVGDPIPNYYEVLLFANNCTDNTVEIAQHFARQHPSLNLQVIEYMLHPSDAYVGRARQLVMDEAYRRLTLLGGRGVIATTDGDTQVSSTWIAANLYEIARGADAVGGRIQIHKEDLQALTPQARAYYLRTVGYDYLKAKLEHYLDPDPWESPSRHYQHCGASLAVSVEAYQRVGGLAPTRTPEDMAFYQALKRIDARFCHSPLVRVSTSGRLQGRTDIGCANQLSQWVEMGQRFESLWVEGVASIESRFVARHQLRKFWQRLIYGEQFLFEDIKRLSDQLGLTTSWLHNELRQATFFGKLVEQIENQQAQEGIWQNRWPLVKIENAIAALRLRLYQIEQKIRLNPLEQV